MYLIINGIRYTCSRRIAAADSIKYLGVTPAVEEISGRAKMYRDDGFLMCEDDLDGYERRFQNGTLLTVTNAPEPVEPELTAAERREKAYNTQDVIEWDGAMITVTEAAQQWAYYAAEGRDDKTGAITALISEAKASIREQYPDENAGEAE